MFYCSHIGKIYFEINMFYHMPYSRLALKPKYYILRCNRNILPFVKRPLAISFTYTNSFLKVLFKPNSFQHVRVILVLMV